MPRRPRIIVPDLPQHVILRGNNREPVFCEEVDYQFFRDKLIEASKKYNCAIHSYVFMTNHIHLLVTPKTEDGISKMIQYLGRYYVQYFNHCYKRTGTMWEGRFKSSLVDRESYFLVCMRYIELNPVRAGMVDHPSAFQWSSYRHNALGKIDPLVTLHDEYLGLGPTEEKRQRGYRALYKSHISDKTLEEIRKSANKNWVLGSDYFKEKVEKQLKRKLSPGPWGGDRKSKEFKQSIK